MMDAMDTQSPTYSDDELTASLAEHLASLDRDDSYRVERVLKCSDVETTELVYFEGSGGGSLGPFVRKRIDASAQIGGAYERLERLAFDIFHHHIELLARAAAIDNPG